MEFSNQIIGFQELIQFLLSSFLILVHRSANNIPLTAEPETISDKVIRFITQNYDKELTLADLSNYVYVSPYHLSHTFKENVGVSPIQFLIQYRIDEAKKMLIDSNIPIREIAYKVGYPNANYFNLLFKKMTGMAPGKFRKKRVSYRDVKARQ